MVVIKSAKDSQVSRFQILYEDGFTPCTPHWIAKAGISAWSFPRYKTFLMFTAWYVPSSTSNTTNAGLVSWTMTYPLPDWSPECTYGIGVIVWASCSLKMRNSYKKNKFRNVSWIISKPYTFMRIQNLNIIYLSKKLVIQEKTAQKHSNYLSQFDWHWLTNIFYHASANFRRWRKSSMSLTILCLIFRYSRVEIFLNDLIS